ncbi:Glutathione S-transferase F2, partial [Folsomia candida]
MHYFRQFQRFYTIIPFFSLIYPTSQTKQGCILYVRLQQNYDTLDDSFIHKVVHPPLYYSMVLFNNQFTIKWPFSIALWPLVSRHNGNLAITLLSKTFFIPGTETIDFDAEIIHGGYEPTLSALLNQPEFIFVLILRGSKIPKTSCINCRWFSFTIYLALTEARVLSDEDIQIQRILLICHFYSQQMRDFRPLPGYSFSLTNLHHVPFVPTDTNNLGNTIFIVIAFATNTQGPTGGSHGCKREMIFKNVKIYLSSFYLLFSLLLREPIRSITAKHATFVLLTLLLSWSYEGCITSNLIAPVKPFRYENVGQFINSSQKVVTYVSSKESDADLNAILGYLRFPATTSIPVLMDQMQ